MIIRKATIKDLKEYLELKKESLEHFVKISKDKRDFIKSEEVSEFKKMLKSKKKNVFILENENEIIGFMILTFYANKFSVAFMDLLHIKKDFQGKGYGKLMVKEFIKLAKNKKIEKVGVGTRYENKTAQKLYESLGFKIIGLNYGLKLK